jgi:stage III sporulation protein AA
MSPEVIITDEIGSTGDKDALMQVINAGVKIITTAHGFNISQLKLRKEVLSMFEEKVFDRLVVLSSKEGPGTLEEVIDGSNMKFLYRRV